VTVLVPRYDGRVKTRLVPDPVRGPVVTQIFLSRALERRGAWAEVTGLVHELELTAVLRRQVVIASAGSQS
jgi:hypothetical protein